MWYNLPFILLCIFMADKVTMWVISHILKATVQETRCLWDLFQREGLQT